MTIESINLFPIKICKTKCDQHDKIKKHILDNVYKSFCEHGPNNDQLNSYSDYLPGGAMVHWPYLINLYMPTIKKLLVEMGIADVDKWSIRVAGWYNISTKMESTFFHDHTGGPSTIQFSIVHYVSLSKTAEGTVFQNPNLKQIKATVPTKDLKLVPGYFLNYYETPDVEEGDMIIFPAWIDHSMPVHTDDSLRITNAMNVMLRIDNSDGT